MNINSADILKALQKIQDPDLHQDIVSLGFIKNLVIENGKVSFTIEVATPAYPAKEQFKSQAQEIIQKMSGVTEVVIQTTFKVRPAPLGIKNIPLPDVKNLIAVASGKGGVGKSTVAANLALALANTGAQVGLMDADVYGPSIPRILGAYHQSPNSDPVSQKILPFEKFNIKFISIGMLQNTDAALIWRGPMASKMIQQFLAQVEWGALDYLIIDLPPGTGDIQLTLTQSAPLAGAVLVTTPQEVASTITQKGLRMFQQVHVPILGIVENMSGFICSHCHTMTPIFKKGGGKKMSSALGVPFLGEIPLEPIIAEDGDIGYPTILSHPESVSAQAYANLAIRVTSELSKINMLTESVKLQPQKINIDNPQNIILQWEGGKETSFSSRYLRSMCPCASCVNENTGQRMITIDAIPPDIKVLKISPVGRYAIHFEWSDGHGSGLYPFDLLLKLSQ